MSDQETKPAKAANAPIEDIKVEVPDVTLPDAEPTPTKADEPTKPETTTEASDVKPEKLDLATEDTAKAVDGDKLKKVRHSILNPPEGMLRTGGRRRAEEDHKKNVKFDPTTLPDTDDPNLIRTQV